MLWLDEDYLHKISYTLRNFHRKGPHLFNCSCPICGDSQLNKRKARGYFYEHGTGLHYKCHNCNVALPFRTFLSRYYTDVYKAYKLDYFRNSNSGTYMPTVAPAITEESAPVEESLFDQIVDRVTKLPEDHIAVKYLIERQIPRDKWNLFYHIDNIVDMERMAKKYEDKLVAEPRLIIPAYNRRGKMIGLIGRSYKINSPLKYVIIMLDRDTQFLYGMDRVKLNDTIYVVEGPIDSLFLPNAIAAGNADFSFALANVPKTNTICILDNQPRNRNVLRSYYKLANKGYKLFIWPENLSEVKDINDWVKLGASQEDITNIIQENSYDGLTLKLKLASWAKVQPEEDNKFNANR